MIAKYRNQAYYIIVGNLHQDGVGLLPTTFDTATRTFRCNLCVANLIRVLAYAKHKPKDKSGRMLQ